MDNHTFVYLTYDEERSKVMISEKRDRKNVYIAKYVINKKFIRPFSLPSSYDDCFKSTSVFEIYCLMFGISYGRLE